MFNADGDEILLIGGYEITHCSEIPYELTWKKIDPTDAMNIYEKKKL